MLAAKSRKVIRIPQKVNEILPQPSRGRTFDACIERSRLQRSRRGRKGADCQDNLADLRVLVLRQLSSLYPR